MKRAVVVMSGGIDSTVSAYVARNEGFELYAITFQYGQRHSLEVEFAREQAKALGVKRHLFFSLDLGRIGGSSLTDRSIPVPKMRSPGEIPSGGIPSTYVPSRNIIFLSISASYAEVVGASDIFIGVNVIDYSGYPDCRPEFIEAFEKAINLGTKRGVEGDGFRIRTPLINMGKADIIRLGLKLGVDFSLTWSCYDPSGKLPCGRCDSCILRKKAFEEVGIPDPLLEKVDKEDVRG